MSEFFELFAQIYANLVLVDLDEYPEGDRASSFVYIVRDWLDGTPPETDDPFLTLALLAIEKSIEKEGKAIDRKRTCKSPKSGTQAPKQKPVLVSA